MKSLIRTFREGYTSAEKREADWFLSQVSDLQYDRCGSKICDLCYRKSDSVGKMSFENADGEISAEQVGS